MPGLFRDVGNRLALPQQEAYERAAQSVGAKVPGDAGLAGRTRLLVGALVDAPAPVAPVVIEPRTTTGAGKDQLTGTGPTVRHSPLPKIAGKRAEKRDDPMSVCLGRIDAQAAGSDISPAERSGLGGAQACIGHGRNKRRVIGTKMGAYRLDGRRCQRRDSAVRTLAGLRDEDDRIGGKLAAHNGTIENALQQHQGAADGWISDTLGMKLGA